MAKNPNRPAYASKPWFDYMFHCEFEGCDRWGHQWRASQLHRHFRTIELVKPLIQRPKNQIVLDVGCGLGDFTAEVQRLNSKIRLQGMDISEIAVRSAAKKYSHIEFTVGKLPGLDCKFRFNGIISLDCVFYLSENNRIKSFRNIYNCLNRGGWYVFSSPIDDGSRYFDSQHAVEQIENAGFSIQKVLYIYGYLYKIIEKPLMILYDLPFAYKRIALGTSDHLSTNRQIIKTILSIPVLRSFIYTLFCAVSFATQKFLQQISIVIFCDRLSRRLFKKKGRSHIIITAIKP